MLDTGGCETEAVNTVSIDFTAVAPSPVTRTIQIAHPASAGRWTGPYLVLCGYHLLKTNGRYANKTIKCVVKYHMCRSPSVRWSVKRSILALFRSTLRSWLYLHLKPLVHWPARKYSQTMDLGSTPGGTFGCLMATANRDASSRARSSSAFFLSYGSRGGGGAWFRLFERFKKTRHCLGQAVDTTSAFFLSCKGGERSWA